jgi:hypothetical protein
MARLVRATCRGTVLEPVARAMTDCDPRHLSNQPENDLESHGCGKLLRLAESLQYRCVLA